MIDNRRKPEASTLRQLFHEQWKYLCQLVDDWEKQKQLDKEKSSEVLNAVETVVQGTDPRVRGIGSYKTHLRECVRSVLEYIDHLVEDLPPAVTINQHAFGTDPLVNSLFINKNDITRLFSRCHEIHEFFKSTEHYHLDEVFALLMVSMHESTILGKKLQGDMLLSDVMQTSINFSGHQLLFPGESEESVRSSLDTLLFENIVSYIKINLTQLHYHQVDSVTPDKSLKNPEVYLQNLVEHMNEPMELIKRQQNMLKISKLGIRLDDDDTEVANQVVLNEVRVGELPSHILVLVRYPRQELIAEEKLSNKTLM